MPSAPLLLHFPAPHPRVSPDGHRSTRPLTHSGLQRPLRPIRRHVRPGNPDGPLAGTRHRLSDRAKNDPAFQAELDGLLHDYVGRPTPLYFAERWTEQLGGAKIYLKREDLLHTGAHKINNALGQILLAKRLGKKRIIAETGAGQHGVATATVCARFGMECVIYMGKVDMERQALNVARMRLMGAEVRAVTAGQATLKEAVNEAMRDWVTNVDHTHYILGSALGSHPFPMMVRDFHRVIGVEARRQILEKEGRLPDLLVACVGGGSNAIGLFHPFLDDEAVRMVGVEAGGDGIIPERHAARFQGGKLGVLQGTKTWLLANDDGQIELTHSVSAGLDYAAVGPEHAYLHGHRPRRIHLRHRRRGARRLQGTRPQRGHHPRAGKRPRHGLCLEDRPAACRRTPSSSPIYQAAATRMWNRRRSSCSNIF